MALLLLAFVVFVRPPSPVSVTTYELSPFERSFHASVTELTPESVARRPETGFSFAAEAKVGIARAARQVATRISGMLARPGKLLISGDPPSWLRRRFYHDFRELWNDLASLIWP